MGLSSSQARLLHLTGRMHQIEYKAQKLEAQKLQLANESDRVYGEYLEALDATKIQYRTLNPDGTATFKDATMNAMQNGIVPDYAGEKSPNILFLQTNDGKIIVTPTVADEFDLKDSSYETRDMDTFISETTGERKIEKPVYETQMLPDSNVITSFTHVPNTNEEAPNITNTHSGFTPVENEVGGVDYDALKDYAEFNPSHTASTAGATALGDGSSIIAGGTYTISTADELKALMDNGNETNTLNTTFILTNNINMSSISGWRGIKDFAGTFDGNGYIISDLSGTNGLFASTKGATIQNVGLENLKIKGYGSTGGLIGSAQDTDVSFCYTKGDIKGSSSIGGLIGYYNSTKEASDKTNVIHDVYSWANVEGISCIGGLIGESRSRESDFNIYNAYAVGNVTGSGEKIGGFAGYMYNDQDTPGKRTDITKAYAGGVVNGSNIVGGFFGEYLYWGDGGDYCYLTDLNSTAKVICSGDKKGAMIGLITISMDQGLGYDSEDQKYVNFVSCKYIEDSGTSSPYGKIYDKSGNDVTSYVSSNTSTDGLTLINLAGSIPSIESGAYMSNILGVLTKAEVFDGCDDSDADVTAMKGKITTFLNTVFPKNDTNNVELWYLNEFMVEYLKNGSSSDKALANALFDAINSNSKTPISSYITGTPLSGKVSRGAGEAWDVDGTHGIDQGSVDVPSVKTIADQVYYAMKKEDKNLSLTIDDVETWFSTHYNTSNFNDKVTLANINYKMNNTGNLSTLYNAIKNGSSYSDSDRYSETYKGNPQWEINISSTDSSVTPETGSSPQQVQVGTTSVWDTSNPKVATAMAMWFLAQRGIKVATDFEASSVEYLSNITLQNDTVFTTFEPKNVSQLASMTPEEIMALTDKEYNEILGIVNTSVAVETFLREVPDEKNLRKAEAKYEADMRRIDKKDRKYDTDLAALETERSATKEEIETLKTVAKDNVDRTFKLFS